MAYVGFRKVKMAPWKNDNSYGEAFQFGKGIGLQVSPNYAEGSLYADDQQSEYDKEFRYADVTLNTNTIPKTARETMFGHTETEEKGTQYKSGDESTYVGMGWISVEKVDGVRTFTGNFMHKVKFSEPSEDYTTKGENIEYKTPSISGRAIAQSDEVWKSVKGGFDTEAEAQAYIDGLFGTAAN